MPRRTTLTLMLGATLIACSPTPYPEADEIAEDLSSSSIDDEEPEQPTYGEEDEEDEAWEDDTGFETGDAPESGFDTPSRADCLALQDRVDEARIVAIGDSMLDFLGPCRDVPELVGARLGVPLRNAAVGGATLLEDIPDQLPGGSWDWVLANGGGNDVECDRRQECDRVVQEVLEAWTDFARAFQGGSTKLMIIGYPDFAPGTDEGDAWAIYGDQIASHQANLAQQFPHVHFVDLRQTIDGQQDPSLFDRDGVHFAPSGAQQASGAIADALARAGL